MGNTAKDIYMNTVLYKEIDSDLLRRETEDDDSTIVAEKIGVDSEKIKVANRKIVSKVTDKDVRKLVNERQQLVGKKFKEGLSSGEEKRLVLLDWELDRIDDARYGEDLDRLEMFLIQQEKFANQIKDIVDDFKNQNLI